MFFNSVTTWPLSGAGARTKNNKMTEIIVRNLRMLVEGSRNVVFCKAFQGTKLGILLHSQK
jgi:hypothetical protein